MKKNPTKMRIISILMTVFIFLACMSIPSGAATKTSATVSEIPRTGWLWPAPTSQSITCGYNLSDQFPSLKADRKYDVPKYPNHAGIDIGGVFEVKASRDGVVVKVVPTGTNMGTNCLVVIEHTLDNGKVCYSRYLHFKSGSIRVKKGDHVKAGTILGTSGNTGYSTGPHLHFEISTVINPGENVNQHINVNPKKKLGIENTYKTRSIGGKKYYKSDFEAELYEKSVIDYSLTVNEVNDIITFKNNSKNICYNIILTSKTSKLKFYSSPSESALEQIQKNVSGKYFHCTYSGLNSKGIRYYLVDCADDLSLIGTYVCDKDVKDVNSSFTLTASCDRYYLSANIITSASSYLIQIKDMSTNKITTYKTSSARMTYIKGRNYQITATATYKIGKKTYQLLTTKTIKTK